MGGIIIGIINKWFCVMVFEVVFKLIWGCLIFYVIESFKFFVSKNIILILFLILGKYWVIEFIYIWVLGSLFCLLCCFVVVVKW